MQQDEFIKQVTDWANKSAEWVAQFKSAQTPDDFHKIHKSLNEHLPSLMKFAHLLQEELEKQNYDALMKKYNTEIAKVSIFLSNMCKCDYLLANKEFCHCLLMCCVMWVNQVWYAEGVTVIKKPAIAERLLKWFETLVDRSFKTTYEQSVSKLYPAYYGHRFVRSISKNDNDEPNYLNVFSQRNQLGPAEQPMWILNASSQMLMTMARFGFDHLDCANAVQKETIATVVEMLSKLERGRKQNNPLSWLPPGQAEVFEQHLSPLYPIEPVSVNIEQISELCVSIIAESEVLPVIERVAAWPIAGSEKHSQNFLEALMQHKRNVYDKFTNETKASLWANYQPIFLLELTDLTLKLVGASEEDNENNMNIEHDFPALEALVTPIARAFILYPSLHLEAAKSLRHWYINLLDARIPYLIYSINSVFVKLAQKSPSNVSSISSFYPPHLKPLVAILIHTPSSVFQFKEFNDTRNETISQYAPNLAADPSKSNLFRESVIADVWFLLTQFLHWFKKAIQLLCDQNQGKRKGSQTSSDFSTLVEFVTWQLYPHDASMQEKLKSHLMEEGSMSKKLASWKDLESILRVLDVKL